ncbi:DUF429 domain-containing protein [Cellulomonas sp. Leaf395]|uniref:DUF429 domain-containing protein n=1 Tax=Cellulomonas sp. Leaf395 TaxID=1736362 RepID=UPI001910E37F
MLDGADAQVFPAQTFAALTDAVRADPPVDVVAVDSPIGLPDNTARTGDVLARGRLCGRASSVSTARACDRRRRRSPRRHEKVKSPILLGGSTTKALSPAETLRTGSLSWGRATTVGCHSRGYAGPTSGIRQARGTSRQKRLNSLTCRDVHSCPLRTGTTSDRT